MSVCHGVYPAFPFSLAGKSHKDRMTETHM